MSNRPKLRKPHRYNQTPMPLAKSTHRSLSVDYASETDWQPMQRTQYVASGLVSEGSPPQGELWTNDLYAADVKTLSDTGWRLLQINRLDGAAIHNWRDFQRIKNDICGPETEGFEVYPAESRLMDTRNVYHLWVFDQQFPLGYFTERNVTPGGSDSGIPAHIVVPISAKAAVF